MNTRPNHETVINAVACDMTAYEPSPDFRARVIGQLDATSRRAWLPIASAIAATAAIVAGVTLLRSPDGVPASGQTVATTVPVSAPSGPLPEALRAADSPTPTSAAVRTSSGPRRAASPSADELAWLARALPPLPDVPALAIDPIQPETLSIAPIVVTPLVTEPLSVPPADAGAGGRHPQS